MGRLTRATAPDPDGAGAQAAPVTSYAYDADGRLVSVTDPLGRVTSSSYDANGRLTGVTAPDPDGAGPLAAPVTSYAYDALGRQTSTTDPLGRVTRTAYDARGRVSSTTDALGKVRSFSYDAVGNPVAVTDELGRQASFTYDADGRLTRATAPDPDGAGPLAAPVTTYEYDAMGRRTRAVNPLGFATTSAYDARSRPTSTTDPLGRVRSRSYDAAGQVLSETDELGRVTRTAYDNLGRVTAVTDPRGGQTAFAYDAAGNRTAVTDPVGNRTAYTYDALDRVTAVTDPLGQATTFSYDAAGQLTSKTDRNGRRTAYDYDGLGRRTAERWLDGAGATVRTIGSTYDAAGQLTKLSDPDSALAFTYDAGGRPTQVDNDGTPGQPRVVLTSGYDAVGNRTSLADSLATAGSTTYGYDALDRLTTISRTLGGAAGPQVRFGYDAASRRTSASRTIGGTGTAVASSYGYDADDRLTSLAHQATSSSSSGGSTTTTLASYSYGYDAADRLTSETNAEGTASYAYDATDQLTGVSGSRSEGYSYDLNGNRTMSGYTTGAGNRLTAAPGSTYAYDAEGNLSGKTETATGTTWTYAYDHRNRLTGVTRKNSSGAVTMQASYTYDALDRRIGTLVDADGAGAGAAVRTWTAYDGENPYADFDGAGALTQRYLHGAAVDEVLARTGASGATAWYLADKQGTVRDIASTSGTVIDHVAYDSFGRVSSETNPSNGDRFKYTGREYDAETGMYYYRARYYDPQTGRFIAQDPIGFDAGDANLYRYVGNGPTNATDPSGLDMLEDIMKPGYGGGRPWGANLNNPMNVGGYAGHELANQMVPGTVSRVPDYMYDGRTHFSSGGGIDGFQDYLDKAGVLDPTGFFDGLNALIYLARGQYGNAAVSAAGAFLPYAGDLAKLGRFGDDAAALAKGRSISKTTTGGTAAGSLAFGELSSGARRLVGDLKRSGSVSVGGGIRASDLAQASRFTGRELAVVQKGTSLRALMGTPDGITKGMLRPGESFLVHTHPVFSSIPDHFRLDIRNATNLIESVIDWSGNVTHFNRSGIFNNPAYSPINSLGYIVAYPLAFFRRS